MNLPWQKIYLIGIGGAGMTAIAQLLHDAGIEVIGSDREQSKNTNLLQQQGIKTIIGHQHNILDNSYDLIIYSAAINSNNSILQQATKLNIATIKRGLFLPQLANHFNKVIAISGSHGKSTVTTLLVHLLLEHKIAISYLIGAQPQGFNCGQYKKNDYLILEIDESDGSFAEIHPHIGVIINADYDHDWSVGGQSLMQKLFQKFAYQSQQLLVTNKTPKNIYKNHSNFLTITNNKNLQVPLYGEHNQLNATIAYYIARQIEPKINEKYLTNFKGLNRRMATIYSSKQYIIIEDYAHHPQELEACLNAIRQQFPKYFIQLIFQPHRYERVKKYAKQFNEIFNNIDQVFITPTFEAWIPTKQFEENQWQKNQNITIFQKNNWQEIARKAWQTRPTTNCITLIIGAATIEKVIPHLKQLILQQQTKLKHHSNHTWRQLTTASVGTTIPYLYQPENITELQTLLKKINQLNLPYKLVCCGSNLIGTDQNYDGVIIQLQGQFNDIEVIDNGRVLAGAAVRLTHLVNTLSSNKLGGGEVLIAIPGGIGGSIRMNAGAQGKEIADFVIKVYGLNNKGEKWQKKANEINWSYRNCDIPQNIIITNVKMQFSSEKNAQEKIEKTRLFRKSTQPGGKNAGCTFINPLGDSSGRLIDKYNLKGTFIGDCIISSKHANFFINQGQATAQDLKQLINKTRQHIFQQCGIILQLENIFIDDWQPQFIKPYNITIFKGGISSEREISLKTGTAIATALRSAGHQVTEIDITEAKLPFISANTDIVFPALHGEFGEDGQIQKLLTEHNIKFIGCNSQVSQLIINKYNTNKFLTTHHFTCPQSINLQKDNYTLPSNINFPVIIKPQSQGSTIGLTLVKEKSQLSNAIQEAFQVDNQIMIEQFIQGNEVTVGLIHGKALPVIEVIPPNEIFDYQAKYCSNQKATQYFCPPKNISTAIQQQMQKIAEDIYQLINAKDLIRIDMIYSSQNQKIYIIEINTLPGFTASSLLPMAAKVAGTAFTELCSLLIHKNLQSKENIQGEKRG